MTFIVSEIGVNWDGDFELVNEMIHKSKECGCDAVKFQSFTYDMIKDHPEHERLAKSSISKHNIDEINNIAKSVGIEWFCTPMYEDSVELLEPYVNRFKIREKDGRSLLNNTSSSLIERVLKSEKQVIISSQTSPKNCKYYNKQQIKWLFCIPKYPCDISELDFGNIRDFDGYSNHCPEIIAPLKASMLGSEILEVHVTLDKSKQFVDNNVSFDFKELKTLVSFIRLSDKFPT